MPRALASLMGRRDPRTAVMGVAWTLFVRRQVDSGGHGVAQGALRDEFMMTRFASNGVAATLRGDDLTDEIEAKGELGRTLLSLVRSLGLRRLFSNAKRTESNRVHNIN